MNQAPPKTIRISLPAAEKMARELKAGHFYRIELSAFTWCGPAYRLVQTKEARDGDLEIRDEASALSVTVDGRAAEYFETLDIILASLFGDENLVVKEGLPASGSFPD